MNNFYYKIVVPSVGIALGFALGANKEAKAATFSLRSTAEFFIVDTITPFGSLDRRFTNERGFEFPVSKGTGSDPEERAFYEFSISNLSPINRAIFRITSDGNQLNYDYPYLGVYGYIGNGKADLSDFDAGRSLGEPLGIQLSRYRGQINFDVTQFVHERVSDHDAFVGFSIFIAGEPPRNGNLSTANISRTYFAPVLIVETADAPEPVPEPTTIFGSALALGVGGWLKRKKSS